MRVARQMSGHPFFLFLTIPKALIALLESEGAHHRRLGSHCCHVFTHADTPDVALRARSR